jgi:GT2 family glycosyltransferase
VSVIIPNWNGRRHLPECLESLSAQRFGSFEVLLVDNASDDGSVAWVRARHPEVRVIERADNGGFSRAVNLGVLCSRAEYVAFLNNDTAADPEWLAALVEALDRLPFDIAASMILLYDTPELLNAAGDVYDLRRLAGRNRGFGEPASRYLASGRVLGACAGAALYRRSLFDDVGLFDEDFFLMSEDTDFNLRCLIAGKRCVYVPGARVRHKLGVSIVEHPAPEMRALRVRNEGIVAGKDLPRELLPLVLVIWAFRARPRDLWRDFRDTVPLRPQHWHRIPELMRARARRRPARDFWGGFLLGLRKRRAVWWKRGASRTEIVRWVLKGSR